MAAASQRDLGVSRLGRDRSRIVIGLAAAVAVATIATGLIIRWTRGGLGTATPPFVADWAPAATGYLAVTLAAAAAASVLLPRLSLSRLAPWAFAVTLLGATIALGLAVNLAHHGPSGWDRVFDTGPGGSFEAANEYLPGLPSLSYGVGFYLDRFAELVPSQPVHVAGHPPGPLLVLHALGITTASGQAALCIGVGALTAPLTYALARTLHDERVGRRAGVLCAASPVALVFGVTSMDWVYAAFGAGAACLLVAPRPAVRVAGAIVLAVASLFSWALLAVGVWAAIVTWGRRGVRPALLLATTCAVAVVGGNAVLAAAVGYDPIGTLRATEGVYRNSVASQRPYWFWIFGSPVAWAVLLGPPIAAAALRAAAVRDAGARALVAVVVIAALGGFTKAETERIWLFLVPLACAAAASQLVDRRMGRVVIVLLAQAVAIAVLFETVW